MNPSARFAHIPRKKKENKQRHLMENTNMPTDQPQLLNNRPDVVTLGFPALRCSCTHTPPPCFSRRHGSPSQRILGGEDVEAGSRKGRSEARTSKREVKMQEEKKKRFNVSQNVFFFKINNEFICRGEKGGGPFKIKLAR